MYASLLISLLAAFVAMLGKQWLNRYLRNSGGSVIERCGDRQRKCDGLEKWPFRSFVESLPLMLQTALLLLACGLCRHMWSINTLVARTLISLTGLGVIFYIAIVIAGMSSYACPFQTPASTALRGLWKKVRGEITMWSRRVRCRVVSYIVHSKRAFSWTHGVWNRRVQPLLHRQSSPAIPLENVQVQPLVSVSFPDNPSPSESFLTPEVASLPVPSPLPSPFQSEPWLTPKDLGTVYKTNTSDARCVSWILRNITDPEALDAALPPAGEIRWFDDGVDVNPPYDLIVSTFEACFDSTKTLNPELRDRAYYSVRAMMWIHTLAMCKSEELASTFPLPVDAGYTTLVPDPDLRHLLWAESAAWDLSFYIVRLLKISPGHTLSHSQWVSNLLLHCSWANRTKLDHRYILDCVSRPDGTKTPIPLNTALNRLLVLCTFLGSPIEEEALKVQDKLYDISCSCSPICSLLCTSDRIKPILNRLSKVVLSAINGTPIQREFIPHMLRDLVGLENRPERLTEIVYEWCSVICENRESLQDWESLLLFCLEIGFRHLDFQRRPIEAMIVHTEHHRELADVVFKSQESEAIADLLHAWTAESGSRGPAHALLGFCTGHLIGLHNLVPFSPRLRRLIIRSVELIGYEGFKGVGVEGFIGLLNYLHVAVEDMDEKANWRNLLLDTIQSWEGAQHLSHWYWESLVKLAVSESWRLRLDITRSLQIITSLAEAKEWSKLECWMGIVCVGVVWTLLPWKANAMVEADLGHSILLLFRQRPGAVQKLERWMGRWGQKRGIDVPESFKQICKQAHEAAQRDAP